MPNVSNSFQAPQIKDTESNCTQHATLTFPDPIVLVRLHRLLFYKMWAFLKKSKYKFKIYLVFKNNLSFKARPLKYEITTNTISEITHTHANNNNNVNNACLT